MRISSKDLEAKVEYLNEITGNPGAYFNKVTKKANLGHYCIDGAYGGVSLHQVVTDGGGVRDIFNCGHVSKRELFSRISAYILGIEAGK